MSYYHNKHRYGLSFILAPQIWDQAFTTVDFASSFGYCTVVPHFDSLSSLDSYLDY